MATVTEHINGNGSVPTDKVVAAEEGVVVGGIGQGSGYKLNAINLGYKVRVKNANSKDMEDKTLIHPVSFAIRPNEMLAIMGASGAGKSTMLDILATRIPRSNTTGDYFMNGEGVGRSFKRVSGYVMQDDALYPLLTVRETFQYAALLRISNMTRAQKFKIVEDTIDALRLGSCADTIIGDERHRGLSGGEKRRVSIGVDIVHQPSVIFLDEPTSGLDSTTALQIVETLKTICNTNRTVAMTIHQPSSRVFEAFDKIMFMSKGHMVYHHTPEGLGAFIQRVSKKPLPAFCNLPELFLEVVDQYEKDGTVTALVQHREEDEMNSFRQKSEVQKTEAGPIPTTYANGNWAEFLILLHRNFRNVIRTPELFFVRLGLCVLMGLVMGSLFWNITLDESGVNEVAGYTAFLTAFFCFTSLEALPIFLSERGVFYREHGRGAYRVSSYVFANAGVFLPFFFVMAIVFSLISFYMLNLPTENSSLIYLICMVFVLLAASNSFATFISSFVPDAITGNGAGTAVFAFFFLFSGFFIPANSIPRGWIWLYYLSVFRYPFEGQMRSFLETVPNADELGFYEKYNVDGWNRWTSVYVLVIFFVLFRVMFYGVIRIKHTGNR